MWSWAEHSMEGWSPYSREGCVSKDLRPADEHILISLFMYVQVMTHLWRSEDNLESEFPLYPVGTVD